MNAASPAGFWIRAVAFVLDLVVLGLVQASFDLAGRLVFGTDSQHSWTVGSVVSFFGFVFFALYTTVLHAVAGQTIGKLLTRVRVVGADGEPPLAGAAFLRWLGYGVSCATLGLGFLMAGLRADKRALHDLIAGTRVERVPPFRGRGPAHAEDSTAAESVVAAPETAPIVAAPRDP